MNKIKKITKEIDMLWALIIKKRDKGICQWCKHDGKKRVGVNAHHIIPRARGKATRWCISNGVYLCFYCHHRRLLEYPIDYTYFIEKFLKKQNVSYKDLKEQSKKTAKYNYEELLTIKNNLTYLFEGMNGK